MIDGTPLLPVVVKQITITGSPLDCERYVIDAGQLSELIPLQVELDVGRMVLEGIEDEA